MTGPGVAGPDHLAPTRPVGPPDLARVVVLGAGQAGVQFADSLRAAGHQGAITIVEGEDCLPYQRPPLSKDHLADGPDTGPVPLRGAGFYTGDGITLRCATVVAVDRARRRVDLADGSSLTYTALVFATGADNRPLPVPGRELTGVHGLRTVADADRLRAELADAGSAVVVGAGFIGLEFAAAARARGVRVTVLEAAGRVLGRAVSPEISAYVAAAHRRLGTDLRLGESVVSIEGVDGRVSEVLSTAGIRHRADLVLIGIGAVPRTGLAADAGLTVDNGIVVDAALRTRDPAVFAIGDCARFPSVHMGGPARLESVQNAADHGRHLAQAMLHGPAPYIVLPWFYSHQGQLRIQIAGLISEVDDRVRVGDPDDGRFSVLSYRDRRLVAVESINHPADHLAARRLLSEGRWPTPEEVGEPGFRLRQFARPTEAALTAPRS